MDNRTLHHEPAEYERQDLGAKGVLEFFAGLVVMCAVVGLILWGMFRVMDHYAKKRQPPQNPLVTVRQEDPRKVTPGEVESFAQPRLETDELAQLNQQRTREEETLNTYGWVDEKAGIARIPIDRAMALVAQRGLPTEPAWGAIPGKEKQQSRGTNASKKGAKQVGTKE